MVVEASLSKDGPGSQPKLPASSSKTCLFVSSSSTIGVCPQPKKKRDSAFLKDTFICPLKTGQFCKKALFAVNK